MLPFIGNVQNVKIYRQKVDCCCESWRRGKCGVTANGYGISFWGDEYVLELRGGDQCTALWIY